MNDIIPYLDGCFSVLLTGERGTGKTRLLNETQRRWTITDTGFKLDFSKRGTIEGNKNYENNFEDIVKTEMVNSGEGIFICENVENISKHNQVILFEYLSTVQGGYYEIFPARNIRSQIIVTSNQRLSELYSEKNYLPLIDRVAQQIVELKPVRSSNINGKKLHMENVWAHMQFRTDGKQVPFPESELGEEFYEWLDKLYLPGNFRDLEKIAIYIWRGKLDFRKPILLDYVKEKFHAHIYKLENNFFRFDTKADEITKDFKYELASWAERNYPDTKTLLDKLEIAEKTLYNWKNKK